MALDGAKRQPTEFGRPRTDRYLCTIYFSAWLSFYDKAEFEVIQLSGHGCNARSFNGNGGD